MRYLFAVDYRKGSLLASGNSSDRGRQSLRHLAWERIRVIRHLLLALGILLTVAAAPARAEQRIALVVGNAAYQSVGQLMNAVNDAHLMAETLKRLGFEVTYLSDAGQAKMKLGIAAFGRQLREAGPRATGLFYYAGHGVQSFGTNYLVPVDATLTDAADLPLVAIEAESILRQMFSARNRTNIVILDACRNNPFTNVPSFTERGLAEMKAPTGSFLAYATSPGAVAYDGEGANSPFTSALADAMTTAGLPIEQAFKQVRVAVLAETDAKQTPWDTSSLTNDFVFLPAKAPPPAPPRDPESDLWESVKAERDMVQVALFLRAYPKTRFQAEAQALLSELAAGGSAGKPVTQAPPAPAPKQPADQEQKLIGRAQQKGTIEAYQAYLDAFPEGVFADLAQMEIAALATATHKDPVGEGVTPAAPEPKAPEVPAISGRVTFLGPISDPGGAADGRSLAELIKGSPVYPPLEGLPEAVWKEKDCASCHAWDRDTLCTQAQTYMTRGAGGVERIEHPYGSGFKRALLNWASAGCP